jgi:hypothetical protein
MNQEKTENQMQDNTTEICENCGNVFRVEHLKEGDDWNDFGFRYCAFCGVETDEYANIR